MPNRAISPYREVPQYFQEPVDFEIVDGQIVDRVRGVRQFNPEDAINAQEICALQVGLVALAVLSTVVVSLIPN